MKYLFRCLLFVSIELLMPGLKLNLLKIIINQTSCVCVFYVRKWQPFTFQLHFIILYQDQ